MELADIKKIWLTDEAIHVKTHDGQIGVEYFSDYIPLRNATQKQREKYTTSAFGIHWEELGEDLSFDGFFQPKTTFSRTFSKLQELNISAFARRLGISQPLIAAYIKGSKIPSKARKKEIEKELHRIGKELLDISL